MLAQDAVFLMGGRGTGPLRLRRGFGGSTAPEEPGGGLATRGRGPRGPELKSTGIFRSFERQGHGKSKYSLRCYM